MIATFFLLGRLFWSTNIDTGPSKGNDQGCFAVAYHKFSNIQILVAICCCSLVWMLQAVLGSEAVHPRP